MSYEALESAVTTWAATQPAIRAVIIVGSRARDAYDRWSDLDLVLFTTDCDRYAADSTWLSGFGTAWLTLLDRTGGGHPEWYALYDGGLKLDALLYQIDADSATLDLNSLLSAFPYQGVLARGIRIIFDRLGESRYIPPKSIAPPELPTQEAFDNVVNNFLLDVLTSAKFIARGELWRAQRRLAENLRPKLLNLVEWHAHGQDTWYCGRYIDTWADPRVQAALPGIFPAYEQADMKDALLAMVELFQWLGAEVAANLGFEYPATHQRVVSLIQTILSADVSA